MHTRSYKDPVPESLLEKCPWHEVVKEPHPSRSPAEAKRQA